MKNKPTVTETPASLQIALKKYVKSEITDLKKMIKDAVAEAMANLSSDESGINIAALKKLELEGNPNDIESRDTYVDATDGLYNPAAENTQEKLSDKNMSKTGYVDPDAKARKEHFRKKNGG